MFIIYIFWLSFILIVYSYFLYPVVLLIIEKVRGKVFFKTSDEPQAVSIIIAAYNEESVIESRVRNCLALDYPGDKMEIIVASDGSSDRTVDIVRKYEGQGVTLYAYPDRRGKVNVLNETVPKAKHPIVVFSDANTMFTRPAVKQLVRYFADDRIGCVCGGLQFVNADGSYTADLEGVYWKYETFLKKKEGRRGSLLGANGAIFAIRKELYQILPGDTIIEDFVMPMKILQKGFACVYAPEASAIEEAAHKIVHEKQRRIRIGAGDFQALFRLLPMLNPFKGFPALAFFSHKVLRWFTPFFMIIVFFSGMALWNAGVVYQVIFSGQCLFYLLALIGRALAIHTRVQFKPLSICYYFVSMNTALFLGFFRFLRGTQSVKWIRTER